MIVCLKLETVLLSRRLSRIIYLTRAGAGQHHDAYFFFKFEHYKPWERSRAGAASFCLPGAGSRAALNEYGSAPLLRKTKCILPEELQTSSLSNHCFVNGFLVNVFILSSATDLYIGIGYTHLSSILFVIQV
jgi:hypothetical protein